jgi:hypothetical protein
MSTIKSIVSDRTMQLLADDTGLVSVGLSDPCAFPSTLVALLPRADFLAAVQSELGVRLVPADAIVIERGELPEVRESASGSLSIGDADWRAGSAGAFRHEALRNLALSEYRDAHPPVPPVDEADVDALAEVIRDNGVLRESSSATLARAILASGKVTVTR